MLPIVTAVTMLLPALALAMPTPGVSDTTNTLVPNRLCVKFCKDIYFKGYCKEICTTPSLCQPLTNPLHDQVSAIQPADDISGCSFFSGPTCNGDKLRDVVSPGLADLTRNGWNDRMQSWLCY